MSGDGRDYDIARCVLQKNVTKMEIYWGSYRIRLFFFLTLLQIVVPRIEIIFCINHYFSSMYI